MRGRSGVRRGWGALWSWGGMGVAVALLGASAAFANNPGDPLFCQPQEGVGYLITNSGSDVWTVDPDCFGNFVPSVPVALSSQTPITTLAGGVLTLTVTPSGGNYVYTPPSPGWTGVDTFVYTVTTEWNAAGGSGSGPGNTTRPGGPYTFQGVYAITLNVLPATTTWTAFSSEGPQTVPVPAGSITGCGPQGSPGQGPPPGTVNGCTTAVSNLPPLGAPLASVAPAHGTLSRTGPTGLQYTPTPGYVGPDTFTYYVLGVNTDGQRALSSGQVTMNVTVLAAPTFQKSFGKSVLSAGDTTSLSFTIVNNASAALNGVAFTDALPAGLAVAAPNGVTGSCGGGAITAAAGSGSVSLSGAALAAGAQCTFAVDVVATGLGSLHNVTSNLTTSEGASAIPATADLVVAEAVPLLDWRGLALLVALLVGIGLYSLRLRR